MACGVEVKASMESGGKETEEAEEAQKRNGNRCLPFVPLIPLQWRAAKGFNTVTAPKTTCAGTRRSHPRQPLLFRQVVYTRMYACTYSCAYALLSLDDGVTRLGVLTPRFRFAQWPPYRFLTCF